MKTTAHIFFFYGLLFLKSSHGMDCGTLYQTLYHSIASERETNKPEVRDSDHPIAVTFPEKLISPFQHKVYLSPKQAAGLDGALIRHLIETDTGWKRANTHIEGPLMGELSTGSMDIPIFDHFFKNFSTYLAPGVVPPQPALPGKVLSLEGPLWKDKYFLPSLSDFDSNVNRIWAWDQALEVPLSDPTRKEVNRYFVRELMNELIKERPNPEKEDRKNWVPLVIPKGLYSDSTVTVYVSRNFQTGRIGALIKKSILKQKEWKEANSERPWLWE